jgi:Tol biopolymer transport system component
MLKKVMLSFGILLPLTLFAQTNFKALGNPIKLAGGDGIYYMQPIWSPDGSMIAFTESNYKGLWLLNMGGFELRQLSNETGAGFNFVWSPDSREIMSRVNKYEGTRRVNAIKSFNLENGIETNLSGYTDEKLGLPNWTTDNGQIYYLKDNKIETIETGRSSISAGESPLIYQQNSKIYSVLQNSPKRPILDGKNNEIYLYVRVSPDGKKVTYKVMGGNLYTMNLDGTSITDLGVGFNARWSPDSQYLVYMINTDDGHKFLSSDISISSSDGKEYYQITNTDDRLEMNPDWSADGRQIVFNTYEDGAIYIMKVSD